MDTGEEVGPLSSFLLERKVEVARYPVDITLQSFLSGGGDLRDLLLGLSSLMVETSLLAVPSADRL